jgi:hypothetical protein
MDEEQAEHAQRKLFANIRKTETGQEMEFIAFSVERKETS